MSGTKTRTRKATFAVTLDLPEGVNIKDATDYVRLAIQEYGPNAKAPVHYIGPMTELEPKSVTARIANLVENTTFPMGAPKRKKS